MRPVCPSCGYEGADLLQHVAAAIAFGACPVCGSRTEAERVYAAALELAKRAPAPAYVDRGGYCDVCAGWHKGDCPR